MVLKNLDFFKVTQVFPYNLGMNTKYLQQKMDLVFVPSTVLSLVRLFCNPLDCSLPCFSVHGIFRARVLEWVARPSSRGSSLSKDGTRVSYVSCFGRWFLYH